VIPVDQLGIFGFGVAAVWLTNLRSPLWRRWAPVFGLLAEPCWMYASWTSGQWGVFALTFVYLYSWGNGFRNAWFK
jgi:hypothetical protein